MNLNSEATKGRDVPAPASQKPGDSCAETKQVAPISCRTKFGLAAYLVLLLIATVVLMLWVWSAIPPAAIQMQPTAAQPNLKPATAPEGGEARASDSAELSHYSGVLERIFREDVLYLLLVLIMGVMGGTLYGMLGFCLHLAMNDFKPQWNCWYFFRPLLGAGLALLVFLAIRGGFLTLSNQATVLNPWSTAALAGLCGMFSEQASKMLSEIFKTLFRTQADVVRSEAEDKARWIKEAAETAGLFAARGTAPTGPAQQPQPDPTDGTQPSPPSSAE